MTDDLHLLMDTVREAGEIALAHFEARPDGWDKADGSGPVTEADLAVDAYLKQHLLAARPDHGWLSEETEDSDDRLDARAVFIVDPIDGTRAFIEHSKDWAISAALVQDGGVVAGVVHLPARDATYAAALGQGATLNGAPISVAPAKDMADCVLLTTRPNMDPRHWKGAVPDLRRSFRSSLAYRLCLVAEGRHDGMIALRPTWEWDIAAGTLIVTEAGGHATDRTGTPILFNRPRPQANGIVGAAPALHDALMSRLDQG